jgi:hypothetical protein
MHDSSERLHTNCGANNAKKEAATASHRKPAAPHSLLVSISELL